MGTHLSLDSCHELRFLQRRLLLTDWSPYNPTGYKEQGGIRLAAFKYCRFWGKTHSLGNTWELFYLFFDPILWPILLFSFLFYHLFSSFFFVWLGPPFSLFFLTLFSFVPVLFFLLVHSLLFIYHLLVFQLLFCNTANFNLLLNRILYFNFITSSYLPLLSF